MIVWGVVLVEFVVRHFVANKNILKITQNNTLLSNNTLLLYRHQDDKQQRQNDMNTTLKLAIETYSELTGMSFDDIKNEMMNNECGDVYRRVVLLMLSVA